MRHQSRNTLLGIEDSVEYIVREAVKAASEAERKQLLHARDEKLQPVLSEFAQNKDKCREALSMFADEESGVAYAREIVFKIFQQTFGPLFAVAHTDGMTFEHIDAYSTVIDQKLADGSLPRLHNNSESSLYQFLKTTYLFEQYTYPPHVAVLPGDVVLDCGACFGDVALWAAQCGAAKVFCFEPDPVSWPFLERNIREFTPPPAMRAHGQTIVPVKLALGAERGELRFTSHIGSSRFTDGGEIFVAVTTLDSWRREHTVRPNFIKMDIEGAEPNALAGGRETIAELKPRLAISIYHNFSDLWEIPLALKICHPGYAFYCKKHHPIHECILYAVDKQD